MTVEENIKEDDQEKQSGIGWRWKRKTGKQKEKEI